MLRKIVGPLVVSIGISHQRHLVLKVVNNGKFTIILPTLKV